jgi:opacity protein-like surface antigen
VVVGAGIEHQFGTHWSARAEVLWVGFKDTQLTAPFLAPGAGSPGTVSFSNDMVIGKLGLNYRF